MPRNSRLDVPGVLHHIIARGINRQAIFSDKVDFNDFLERLGKIVSETKTTCYAWVLIPNHYHILMETPSGNFSQIMQHINGAYTTYFNTKHQRSGHLFQGMYKAILVDIDEYAKELSRYIHLNPVRANIVDRPEQYRWSSYQYYIGIEKSPKWLVKDFILGYFGRKISDAQR